LEFLVGVDRSVSCIFFHSAVKSSEASLFLGMSRTMHSEFLKVPGESITNGLADSRPRLQ
jgi:hypothetical protein